MRLSVTFPTACRLFNSSISTGVGDVSIRGRTNVASGQFGDAVNLNDAAVIQTTSGNVTIYGDASARFGNVSFAAGVRLDFTARISSQTGTVLLNGVGAGTPGLPAASGTSGVVVQKDALLEVTGAGRIELVGNGGTSSSATDSVEGVTLLDRARLLADGGGTIVITGSPGTPAPGGHVQNGVALNSAGSTPGVTVRAGGASGSITITGLPANGTVVENANGVVLQQAGTLVEAHGRRRRSRSMGQDRTPRSPVAGREPTDCSCSAERESAPLPALSPSPAPAV